MAGPTYRIYKPGEDPVPEASDAEYRVYEAGDPEPEESSPQGGGAIRPPADGPAPIVLTARRRRRRLRLPPLSVFIAAAVLGVIAWMAIGYLSFQSSMERAHRKLQPNARKYLTGQAGLLLNAPTTILVLGVDRTGRADTTQVLYLNPRLHSVSTIAIPRDLRVIVPGNGAQRLNAAYAIGGPALALRTVSDFTGLTFNHVVVVDFTGFRTLIDAVGGVEVESPTALKSRFDGYTYRFPAGRIKLDGKHALAYARIRRNDYDSRDTDVSRGLRQGQVISGLKQKLVTPRSLFGLRTIGRHLADPIATDLTAGQLMQLGWIDFRARRRVVCTLGGSELRGPNGELLLQSDATGNRRVIDEALSRAALKRPGKNPLAPRCVER